MYLINAVLPVPLYQTFDYISEEFIEPGIRVLLPFGHQKLIGIVKSYQKIESEKDLNPEIEYKYVEDQIDDFPICPSFLMNFLDWVSSYYLSPPGITYKIALPSGIFTPPKRYVFLTEKGKELLQKGELPEELKILKDKKYTLKFFQNKTGLKPHKIRKFVKDGILFIEKVFPEIKVPVESFVRLKTYEEKKEFSEKEREIIEFIKTSGGEVWKKLLNQRYGSAVIKKLINKGILEEIKIPKTRKIPFQGNFKKEYQLTPSQGKVWEEIKTLLEKREFSPILLFGVTGSGKSLIYIEAIKHTLSQNKQVLVLVPEISLTTYMEAFLIHHFKSKIAVLHSGLSPGERLNEWLKILKDEAQIVIGTRSAVFAPLKNLGLIIVDEEHDSSYKEEGLSCKYHARDIAIQRAKMENIPIILGSATPDIKTFYFAKKGKYHLFTLKERPFSTLPEIRVVKFEGKNFLSQEFIKEMEKTLEEGKAVLVYLNRRGYAPVIKCKECGYIWTCPNCGIPLSFHKEEQEFLCHYCGFKLDKLYVCPECKGTKIKFLKFGTQRIEEEIKKIFPEVSVIRLDRDAVSTEKKLLQIMEKLYEKGPKVIVCTQMGIHGHNFPGVSLVGILRAEEGMFLPYYKASEKTFQLLIQACGRAGREKEKGKVIIQTSLDSHYVIKYALSQNYEKFFEEEIKLRKKFRFPPFSKLALIRIEHPSEKRVQESIKNVFDFLYKKRSEQSEKIKDLQILGPSPCPFPKLRGYYRWHIILSSPKIKEIHLVLKELIEKGPFKEKIIIDINPEEII